MVLTFAMTKRISEFGQKNNKKLKLEKDIESFWGDDIDADAYENCINLASQIYEEEKVTTCTQLNNVTLLPSYNAFKQRSAVFSSTQLTHANNSFARPSTSKNDFAPKTVASERDLQEKITTLQQQYKEREGEVSILRAQLQESKSSLQSEQQKLHSEWRQKLTQSERQVKAVKSELEFKNLEIANLKQKISEITKHNALDTSIRATQSIVNVKQERMTVDERVAPTNILQPVLDPIYPLKDLISETIFNLPDREQHITETRLTHTCKNAIPYLQNQSISANVVVDKSDINIDCVFSDILTLSRCTEDELSSIGNVCHLNNIICACEQFMYDLQRFLAQIKTNLRTEDVLEADSRFLRTQDSAIVNSKAKGTGREEIGMKSSVLLDFIAQTLPYNDYLERYVCQDKPLVFKETETIKKQFPYQAVKGQNSQSHHFLKMILNIINTAGKIRKATFMSKFLISTINLLINIHKSRNFDYVSDIFCELSKEIILSRPSVEVVCHLTFLFKAASQHSSFVEYLLNKSPNSVTSKKGILYFNEDACRFYIFVMLFDNNVLGPKSECFSLSVCLNLLCFMYNTFKNCHWIHHRDAKECECIPQLYKLEIEIVSTALEKYNEETKNSKSSEWAHFFKNPITAKVLNLMTFNSYEVTEKYITVFSQYKQIERKLQEDDLIELDKLNITDDVVELAADAFSKVNF